ncbi:MAG: tetratricopeptide repeat protein [Planctomycetota bacterium]
MNRERAVCLNKVSESSAGTDSGVMRVGLVILVGTMIGLGVPGCEDPKDARKYYNQGVARLEKGEHDAAISDLTKAIKTRPRFAMAHFYRGRAYLGTREYDKAISDLTDAVEIDPTLAVAFNERAMVNYIEKEYDRAWEDIRKSESLGLQTSEGFLKALREASGRRK